MSEESEKKNTSETCLTSASSHRATATNEVICDGTTAERNATQKLSHKKTW